MGARRGRWAAVLLAAAGGVAGLAPAFVATAQPAWAFAYNVEVSDNAYSPQVLKLEKGDKVTWRMPNTKGPHSATADNGAFDYKFGARGAIEEFRFNTPGKYTYRCTYEDGMTGTIVVEDPDAPTTTTTASPTTTTTARPTTTTAPPATTTTAQPTTTTAPPLTTTTAPARPPAEVPPPAPNTAAAPPPTLATSSTTTTLPSTTTTTAPATTTSTPPDTAGQVASPSTSDSAPPTTETPGKSDDQTAAGRPVSSDGELDASAVALISLLVAVGLFGAWTLIRVRPGRL